jgi:hypothetical protein
VTIYSCPEHAAVTIVRQSQRAWRHRFLRCKLRFRERLHKGLTTRGYALFWLSTIARLPEVFDPRSHHSYKG